MSKKKETVRILEQVMIAPDIFSMWIESEHLAEKSVPGQFIAVYSDDASRMLPRPISICEIDPAGKRIRIVYRIAGKGTAEFSEKTAGDSIEVMGPLGNGFPMDKVSAEDTAFLIGGGIGVPPILELAKQMASKCKVIVVVGYRNSDMFLLEEFKKYADVVVATEDGSFGTKGNVIDAIKANGLEGQFIYSCGPTPMLRGLKAFADETDMICYISMEEKMACGIGACLACVCKSKEVDGHTNVHNKRICKEGPVFDAREVEL